MKIFGAGLAGLLAGVMFPEAQIFEAGSSDQAQHKAVLRFRTPNVGAAVGIEFRQVRVHKGLWLDGHVVQPTIQLANWYSRKVTNKLNDRSIWNLDAVDRWIAPEDLLQSLAARCAPRVNWNHTVLAGDIVTANREPIISTLPMPVMAKMITTKELFQLMPEFRSAPISVRRWRVPDADVFQTVYFPSPYTTLYRASITGDLLIAESMSDTFGGQIGYEEELLTAFGLERGDVQPIDSVAIQRYGKINPIDDAWRKQFIFDLSQRHNIFSLGRFGTWRNILLDDVLHDISVVRRLIGVHGYDRARHNAGVR